MTPSAPTTLWNRNFVIWWLGSAQSALGSALAGIATSFLVLGQTGSAGAMGVNLALALLPALLSPLFGTLVDRLPVKLPLIAGNLLRAALQLGVGFWASHGNVPIEVLHGAALLTGLVGAFYGPASMGVTPRLIPPSQLQRAGGLMQGSAQTMQMVGLVGGGLLISQVGSAPALILDGISFLVSSVLLTLVRFPAHKAQGAGERYWQSFAAGLRYVRGSPLLMGLPLMDLAQRCGIAAERPDKIRRTLEPIHTNLLESGYLQDVQITGRGKNQTVSYVFGQLALEPDGELVALLVSLKVPLVAAKKAALDYPENVRDAVVQARAILGAGTSRPMRWALCWTSCALTEQVSTPGPRTHRARS